MRQCVATDGKHYYVSGCCVRHCCDRGVPCAAAECLFHSCKGDYDYVDDDTFLSDDATLFTNFTDNQSIFSDDFTNNHSIFSNDTEPVTVSGKTARTHRSSPCVNKKNSGEKTSMRLQSINERNEQEMAKGSKITAKSSKPPVATKSIPASSFLAATTNKDVLGSAAKNEQDGAAKAGETPDASSEVATEDFFGSLVAGAAGAALGLGAAVAAKNEQNAAAKTGAKASEAPDASGSEGAAEKKAPPPSFFDSIVMTRIASLPSIEEDAEEGETSSTPSRLGDKTTSALVDTGTSEPIPLSSAMSSTRSAKSSKPSKTAKMLGSAKSFPGAFIFARSGTKKLDRRDDQSAAHECKRGQIEEDDERESVDVEEEEEESFRLNNQKKTNGLKNKVKTTVFNARRVKTSIKNANKIETEGKKKSQRKLREELVVHRNSI